MSSATFYTGDVLQILAKLPDQSVDLVLTSPPFLALRSYLPADHPDKRLEGGSQSTPGEFVDWLLDVVEACDRVLAPHGSMAFELGDTFAGSGGAGGDYDEDGLREGQPTFRQRDVGRRGDGRKGHTPDHKTADSHMVPLNAGNGWPADKSLSLIPETFRFALAYGFNPHTGRKTTPWRVRNVIRWVRPNPPVGALGDKFRPATSEMVVFCRTDEAGRKRYFDLDAVRGDYSPNTNARTARGVDQVDRSAKSAERGGNWASLPERDNDGAGAPPLDWWNIPTHPYKGAHYATWPPELCVKPVKAMSPERVCQTCGEPSRRMVDVEYEPHGQRTDEAHGVRGKGWHDGEHAQHMAHGRASRVVTGSSWSDCGHGDDWRPGVVLDPFAGSGTTLSVAVGHGRNAIGIDLDERNAELARERVGPMFFHEGVI